MDFLQCLFLNRPETFNWQSWLYSSLCGIPICFANYDNQKKSNIIIFDFEPKRNIAAYGRIRPICFQTDEFQFKLFFMNRIAWSDHHSASTIHNTKKHNLEFCLEKITARKTMMTCARLKWKTQTQASWLFVILLTLECREKVFY